MKFYRKYLSLLLLSVLFLLISLYIYRYYIYKRQQVDIKVVKDTVNGRVLKEINNSQILIDAVSKQISQENKISFSVLKIKSKYSYYIFSKKNLVFWSDNKFFPTYDLLTGNYTTKYFYFRSGKFIITKKNLQNKGIDYEIFVFIPISFKYPITNSYIKSGLNSSIVPFRNAIINNELSFPGAKIRNSKGEYLFTISIPNPEPTKNTRALISILICLILSFSFFSIYIIRWLLLLVFLKKAHLSIVVFLSYLILTRFIMLFLNLPYVLFQWDLFNSKFFAYSVISPSLGDYLLNILFITFFVFFLVSVYFNTYVFKLGITAFKNFHWLSIFLILLSFWGYNQVYETFLTINRHSQWILDINQSISLNLFRGISLLIYVLCGLSYFVFLHIICRLFIYFNSSSYKYYIIYIIGSLVSCFLLLYFFYYSQWQIIIFHTLLFSVVVFFKLPKFFKSLRYESYIYYLIVAGFCSIAGAFSIYIQDEERMLIQKSKFAYQLINENDVLGEYLLSDAQHKIENDDFIKSQFISFFSSKGLIEQKIKKIFLSNYFEKYDVKISLYDPQGFSYNLFDDFTSYRDAANQLSKKEFKTDYKNIFFIKGSNKTDYKKYVVFNRVTQNNKTIGFILIQLFNRKIIPNSVYPELLVDQKFGQSNQSKLYNYAIYSDNDLISNFGTINYNEHFNKKWLEDPKLYNDGMVEQKYHHLGIKEKGHRVIVVSSNRYSWDEIFSNFSFLFILYILFILSALFFVACYYKIKRRSTDYTTKIQIYLNIAFFLPLSIVSIATLSFISSSHTETVRKSFEEKAESISKNIATLYEEFGEEKVSRSNIYTTLFQMARFTNSDINYYSSDGYLVFSSQPMIFESSLLSRLINPLAFIEIKEARKGTVLLSESLGDLNYNSVYVGVRNFNNGKLLGILSIPFYESKIEIENQIINVLTTILNIFVSIFIIFLILSYFASHILTIPLKIITSKIKRTTLIQGNEPLDWQAKDEIGLLVGEYNKMLLKLEESKIALSKNEKELAWREMARQVAHEIKNPLTPMKLTIQYLQKGIVNKDEGLLEKVNKGFNTLLTQIDNLSEIATSFSLFAKMPLPKNDKICITTLLHSITSLFNNSSSAVIISNIGEEQIFIEGDGQLLNGVISNIIINGIQSVPSQRKPVLKVFCDKKVDHVLISISDNGTGIPEEIKDRIFLPNFSTKFAGSGIGLAVAKRSIEHMGGKIWFESSDKKGSIFFIQLKLL